MGDALNNLLLGMRHSLRTRVLFATLVVLVAGIWSLAFYAQEMLHRDMRQMLGQQQATMVAMVAGQIDREFAERLEALEKVAEIVSGVMDQGPAAVQAMLEKRWDLHALFNGGSYVTQAGGTAIADWPLSEGRVGEK